MRSVQTPSSLAPLHPQSWQPSLLDAVSDVPSFDASFATVRRIELEPGAWIDHVAGWLRGAGALFTMIVDGAPWEQRRVHMYDRMVDEPRLTAWYGKALVDPSLPPVVPEIATALSTRYER